MFRWMARRRNNAEQIHLQRIMKRMQNEAWLDEINRIVSFHEISDGRYYSAEEPDFWQVLVELVLSGYRVQ